MPFTPFHLGPGAFLKSLFPRWFSFRVFLLSQIIMDVESAWNIFRGHERLHTFFHSYFGSNVVIVLSLVFVLTYNLIFLNGLDMVVPNSSVWAPFKIRQALITAAIGVWSHVLLDSVMHVDMTPLRPFSDQNPSLHVISVLTLHVICLAGFIFAAIIYGMRQLVRLVLKSKRSGAYGARFWRRVLHR